MFARHSSAWRANTQAPRLNFPSRLAGLTACSHGNHGADLSVVLVPIHEAVTHQYSTSTTGFPSGGCPAGLDPVINLGKTPGWLRLRVR